MTGLTNYLAVLARDHSCTTHTSGEQHASNSSGISSLKIEFDHKEHRI